MASTSDDDGWDEWGADIVEAVKAGNLDRFLKDIVRAAFERKRPTHVIPDGKMAALTRGTIVTSDPYATTMVRECSPAARMVARGTFEVGGRHYLKADAVGKEFYPLPRVLPDRRGVSWRGVKFRVVEVTRVNALLEMIEPPSRMNSQLKHSYENRIPVVVDKAILKPLLEVSSGK